MGKTPVPAEIRAAKKWLERKGFTADDIPPRLFAMASKQRDQSFNATLRELGERNGLLSSKTEETKEDQESAREDG